MKVNFDMDGTIADLYGVEDWLPKLRAEDSTPYEMAKPLVNMSLLARYLNILTEADIEVCIISWGSKNSSVEYLEATRKAKEKWLRKHLPSVTFSEITVVQYGTPKSNYGDGILFDDEEENRDEWGNGAYAETEIFEILKNIINYLDK